METKRNFHLMNGGYLSGIFPTEIQDNKADQVLPLPLTGITLMTAEPKPEKKPGFSTQEIQTMMPQGGCFGCE